jgi:hypothetical protein
MKSQQGYAHWMDSVQKCVDECPDLDGEVFMVAKVHECLTMWIHVREMPNDNVVKLILNATSLHCLSISYTYYPSTSFKIVS